MSFGNAQRHFHLARNAYLDGSDLGKRREPLEQMQFQPSQRNEDDRLEAKTQQRRLAWTRMSQAMEGAFGATSGSVGPSSEAPGLQDRRLLRSPRPPDADAAGAAKPGRAVTTLPGGMVVDIDGTKHRRHVAPKSKPEKMLKRHDRLNNVKSTHKQAEGDYQGRAFFDQIVQAESYANLIGRSEKAPESMLPWAPEESWMTRSAIVYPRSPRKVEEAEEEEALREALPTLLGSPRRGRRAEEAEKDDKENPEEHREVVEAPASSKKALQASVTRIAQESISFGRLLQEAKETLKAGTIPARRLHQQLDALEAKTRQLRADAGASAEVQAQARQAHRQRFDLITRGTGWRTEPKTSQL